MTIRLTRGVTGSRDKNEQLPETDMTAFRRACAQAAGWSRARLGDVTTFDYPCNFKWIAIIERSVTRYAVCQMYMPVVAFTDVTPTYGRPERDDFVDPPVWLGGFEAEGLQVLSAEELRTPLSKVDMSELPTGERQEIDRWRKFLGRDHSEVVVSDVLFNFWD